MSKPVVRSRHVARVVRCAPRRVYEFAADPDNLPQWAAGLARNEVRRVGDTLVAESPMGEVTVRFVGANDYGVLDHEVRLPSGTIVHNPMRVLPHPDGAEIVFTVRQIELTDDEFDRDTGMVEEDLARLAALLES
ncbi:SRPBCC family protein [Rhodococcus sp. R1101]|uniref:SRPBCC family protein n=1 Tax=Rhodococcus sp. R1101 TaxID=1170698 RepID=UPI000475243C|nr:SRPBCC family protein [Rhodococcus sp. R1101]